MNKYTFGEKTTEYSFTEKREVPVVMSPNYYAARKKAIEIIEKTEFGVQENDFWILMNETKTKKMQYSGLIISHKACLKINDKLPVKFCPSSVSVDKDGYRIVKDPQRDSSDKTLVYTYCNDEQGIFEIGEVSAANCKNAYPYAMAFKRLFDRVVLKLSKLAFDGIYSDSEIPDRAENETEEPQPTTEQDPIKQAIESGELPADSFDYTPEIQEKREKILEELILIDDSIVPKMLELKKVTDVKNLTTEYLEKVLAAKRAKIAKGAKA